METYDPAFVKLGWLWFDDDPKTSLEAKVGKAADRFAEKFGRSPQLCYVSPGVLSETEARVERLQLRGARNVRPGHFLFVLEQAEVSTA